MAEIKQRLSYKLKLELFANKVFSLFFCIHDWQMSDNSLYSTLHVFKLNCKMCGKTTFKFIPINYP